MLRPRRSLANKDSNIRNNHRSSKAHHKPGRRSLLTGRTHIRRPGQVSNRYVARKPPLIFPCASRCKARVDA